jgi:DNA polymerase III epsilon subunit-like protein
MHITLDLETLGNGPTAPIVQIGAIAWNEDTVLDEFQATIEYDNSIIPSDFKVDQRTLGWWFQQEKNAQWDVFNSEAYRLPVREAVANLLDWWKGKSTFQVWTHATFDMPILRHLLDVYEVPVPWDYHNLRDIRTLNYLVGDVEVEKNNNKHNAIDDCKYQMRYINAMINKTKR